MVLTKPLKKKKKVAAKVVKNNFLFQKVEIVGIQTLKPHPKNPNIGDVDSIAESLQENGMFRPIVVNTRNGFIAAGHHTWLGARRLGWTEIGVVFIDVDEKRHLKIMLADNATADKRTYDDKLLDEILQTLSDVTGTGYTQLDVEDIHTRATQMAGEAIDALNQRQIDDFNADQELRKSKTFDGSPLGEEPDPDDEDDTAIEDSGEVDGGGNILKAKEELAGMVTLKDSGDLKFEGVGYWGIPRLKADSSALMTFDELPENLAAWAGSATKDWPDEDQWWLYNWGVDSTSGMRDVSKVIISFYTHDEYFDNWWHFPEKFASKVLNSGIKHIVAPNYSQWAEEPHVQNLWSLHRSRWLARYFQEVGLKVVPDINWPYGDEQFLEKHVLGTLPKKLPLIAMQMQTYDSKVTDPAVLKKTWQMVFDILKPKGLLFYAGQPGQKFFREHIKPGCPVKMLDTRNNKLSEAAKKREKKKTI